MTVLDRLSPTWYITRKTARSVGRRRQLKDADGIAARDGAGRLLGCQSDSTLIFARPLMTEPERRTPPRPTSSARHSAVPENWLMCDSPKTLVR